MDPPKALANFDALGLDIDHTLALYRVPALHFHQYDMFTYYLTEPQFGKHWPLSLRLRRGFHAIPPVTTTSFCPLDLDSNPNPNPSGGLRGKSPSQSPTKHISLASLEGGQLFDPMHFLQRGLVLDTEHGNLLKLDAECRVVRATHGSRVLDAASTRAYYGEASTVAQCARTWTKDDRAPVTIDNLGSYFVLDNFFECAHTRFLWRALCFELDTSHFLTRD